MPTPTNKRRPQPRRASLLTIALAFVLLALGLPANVQAGPTDGVGFRPGAISCVGGAPVQSIELFNETDTARYVTFEVWSGTYSPESQRISGHSILVDANSTETVQAEVIEGPYYLWDNNVGGDYPFTGPSCTQASMCSFTWDFSALGRSTSFLDLYIGGVAVTTHKPFTPNAKGEKTYTLASASCDADVVFKGRNGSLYYPTKTPVTAETTS